MLTIGRVGRKVMRVENITAQALLVVLLDAAITRGSVGSTGWRSSPRHGRRGPIRYL